MSCDNAKTVRGREHIQSMWLCTWLTMFCKVAIRRHLKRGVYLIPVIN